jgi:hypothetical protein
MMRDKLAYLYMMMAMGGMFPSAGYNTEEKSYSLLTDEDKARIMARMKEEKRRLLLKKGIKEFTFDGFTVLALNEKNAERKYYNYKKQLLSLTDK